MYEEIIRHLMKWEIVLMIFWTLLCLVLPVSYHAYAAHKAKKTKKKKNKGKKSWKRLFSETPEGRALSLVIIGAVFFCICFGTNLYRYLSLREDMVSENYVTYTGEFECDVVRGSKGHSSSYVRFTNKEGEAESVRYSHRIDNFKENGENLKEGNHKSTIVYSPSSNLLLWWDAVPIGE